MDQSRVHLGFLGLGALYVLLVGLLAIPTLQTHLVYLHAVPYPLFAKYDNPEKYGLAPGKTFNLRIQTADNVTLGAWFVLSDSFYHSHNIPHTTPSLETHVPAALQAHPTILFFHGNAAGRAAPFRVQTYSAFSSRLGANVLAIDYRGFADSAGYPSEDGLVCDARAAWEWLMNMGAKPENVVVVGHSLGAAVAARLAAALGREKVPLRGLVLLSPFSSMRTLLDTYAIFGFIPFGAPLPFIPGASQFVTWALNHQFDTLQLMPDIRTSVLIAHAEDDWDIPLKHSEVLFDSLLEPLLPALPPVPAVAGSQEWTDFYEQQSKRKGKREELVTHTIVDRFGTLDECEMKGRKVSLLRTRDGGHDLIGTLEGVHDVIQTTLL